MNKPLDSLLWVLILTGVLCTYKTYGQDAYCHKIQCANSRTIIITDTELVSSQGNSCKTNTQDYLILLKKNCDGYIMCSPQDQLSKHCRCIMVLYACTETTGQTTAGQTTAGQTTTVQTTAGQTTAGKTTAGKTTAGQTTAGKTTAGQTTTGQTAGGQTTDGRTVDVQTAGGQTAGGQTAGGQTAGATQDNGSNVAIGVTVALLVLIGISVLVFCFVLHRKRKTDNNWLLPAVNNKTCDDDLVIRGVTASPSKSQPTEVDTPRSLSNSGYEDTPGLEENIYHEPIDIFPDTIVGDDSEYNKIPFQGREIVLDPRYGRLNSNDVPEIDPQYSYLTGKVGNEHQYSLIAGNFCNSGRNTPAKKGDLTPSTEETEGDVYNHTTDKVMVSESRLSGDDDDDGQYSHLHHGNKAPAPEITKSRCVGGLHTKVNNPGQQPDSDKERNYISFISDGTDTSSVYNLAKPVPEMKTTSDTTGTYELARPVPERSQGYGHMSQTPPPTDNRKEDGFKYELAKIPKDNEVGVSIDQGMDDGSGIQRHGDPTATLNGSDVHPSDDSEGHAYFILKPVAK